jgi:hypothetical protein
MADIFVSYSRRDSDFVQHLHTTLTESRYDTWVDWEDIPPTAAWWKMIEEGIESAHTCVFVISPDSVASKVCTQEIDHAVRHNKRLIPVVRRDVDNGQVHPALRELNWIFFRQQDNFDSAFQDLVNALNTDLDYAQAQARLLVRALEWQKKDRNSSFLLRGSNLEAAEKWLIQARDEQQPSPTQLQREFITTSRRSASSRQRMLIGTLSILLFFAVGMGLFALVQKSIAEQRQRQAEANLDAACRNIFGMLQGFQTMEEQGMQVVDAEGYALPMGLIFGQDFVRTAHTTFNSDCAQINQIYGWSLDE